MLYAIKLYYYFINIIIDMKRQCVHEDQIIKRQKKEDLIINELSIMRQKIDRIETMMTQLINMLNINNTHNIQDIMISFRNTCSYIG
jgi:hypothetical protein